MILFLKQIVPEEAQTAQMRLERFDESLPVLGLEDGLTRGSDPAAVAKEWRDVAKKYQDAR